MPSQSIDSVLKINIFNLLQWLFGGALYMQSKKMKLADLAKLAGVSTSTASRALNNNPLIKEETRNKLQALAKKHNFSLNAAASRLRLQKTNVIAVLINFDAETEQSIDDPFLLKVVSDINLAVNRQGYELLLSNSYMPETTGTGILSMVVVQMA